MHHIKRIKPEVIEQLQALIGATIDKIHCEFGEFNFAENCYVRGGGDVCIKFYFLKDRNLFLFFMPGTPTPLPYRKGISEIFPMELKTYKHSPVSHWLDKKTRRPDFTKTPFPDLSNFKTSINIHKAPNEDGKTAKQLKSIKIYHNIEEYHDVDPTSLSKTDVISFIIFETVTGKKICFYVNNSLPEFDLYIYQNNELEKILNRRTITTGPNKGKPIYQLVHEIA